jgi:DNA-binding CsgD family transcriptional regulator
MRFREATNFDLPAIAATFDGRNALPLEPRLREALPGLLGQLIASPACTLSVFEHDSWSGPQVFSFAGGLFLRDTVIEEYLATPHPGLVSAVLAAMLDGQRPLLTLDEIRRANSTDGLTLAVLPMPYGELGWDDAQVEQLRRLAPQALVRDIGGYRLRAIYYEVFTDEAASYLRAGGYRLLHDFSAWSGAGFPGPDCRPRMLRLTRGDLPPAAMSMVTQMFDPPPATLGLTLAEQRVALRALDGASDRAIAETLGLSSETVRSSWRSIYRRLSHVLERVEAPAQRSDATTRGLEKRRVAVEYLRQNMHELRPHASRGPALASTSSPA